MNRKKIEVLLRPLLENIPEKNDDVISLADGIANNHLYVSPTVPILDCEGIENFDWNINTGNTGNTFQMSLHAQVHLSMLVCAYNITGNTEYINLADGYFESWMAYISSDKVNGNTLVWNSHTTAMRLISLLYYFFCGKDEISDGAREILNRHISFLADEKNYIPNANQGIFMDRAVLCACILLGEHGEEKEIAITRLKKQCEFAYLPDGAHSENSPSYQYYVWTALQALYVFLSQTDSLDGMEFLHQCCEKSDDFLAWFIQPNGQFALVGDSDNDNLDASAYNIDEHGNLCKYFLSCGTEGIKPEQNYAFYENAGYFFARNFIDETIKDTWFMFKAGAVTNVHKHADDLSILLSSKGYPVFIDCGRYNYVYGDKIRSYVTGAPAHNTVVVDGKTYSICAQRVNRSKIIEKDFSGDCTYIRGRNDGYDGVSIDRAVYRKGDTLLLHDDIISDAEHNYSQHFHLSEHIEIISATDTEFIGRIADSGYVVRITQLEGGTFCDIQNGNEVGVHTGIASCKMGEIHGINTLIFTRDNTQNCRFVTEITIEKEDKPLKPLGFNPNTGRISGRIKAKLKKLDRELIPVKIRRDAPQWEIVDGNKIKFSLNCFSEEEYTVHWLFYRNGGVYSYKYTKNINEYILEPDSEGKYTLVYSIQTADGDRQTWVCDEIQYPVAEEKKYGFGIKKFPASLQKPDKNSAVEIAEQLLHGQLIVRNTLKAEPYCIWNIDWNITAAEAAEAYQMQLQNLRSVMYLTYAFELTQNRKYIDYAWRFVYSWNEYEKSDKSKQNTMCWHSHTMSARINHLIYLAIICEMHGLLDCRKTALIDEIFQKTAEHLCNEERYIRNHTYGIYQDCALLYISYFLQNEQSKKWISLAKKRLKLQFEHAFLPDMVHMENSPEYQLSVIGLFREIEKIFAYANDPEFNFYRKKLALAAKFLSYMIKPDGALAEIGNTNGRATDAYNANAYKGYRYLNCPEIDWAMSQGRAGKKPEGNTAVFPDGGYYAYRSSWKKEQMEDAVWFMFKSGYASAKNKHADDLHFMLNAHGSEIFIDRGKYGYQIGDFTTETLHSVFGHNTVTVDSETYPITAERGYKTGLLKREAQGEFNCAAGYNDSYEGVKIDREIFFKDNIFIVHDNIESDKEHLYTQQFHISEKLAIIAQAENELLAKIDDSPYIVRIRQLSACNCRIIGSQDGSSEFGYRSRVVSETVPCSSLLYSKKAKSTDFVTVITLEKNQLDYVDAKQTDNDTLMIGDSEIKLTHRARISMSDFSVNFKGKNLIVESKASLPDSTEIKISCLDKKWRNVLLEQEIVTPAPMQVYIPFYSDSVVVMQVKTPDGYRIKGVICSFRFNQESKLFEIVDGTDNCQEVKISNVAIKFTSDDCAQISATVDYFWDYSIDWYFYKDGQRVKWQSTPNNSAINYQFTSAGNYYVMLYVATPDGDRLQYVVGNIKITPEQLEEQTE
ncbi:MAG: heparinase II/III family protein [Clostridia bacterium]|nr:heparinase II/III family protein [Clostridia bacterium]